MAQLRFSQVNVVLPDVEGAAAFLRALGAGIDEVGGHWAAWAPHHVGASAVDDPFSIDLDSAAFAAHWGGLPRDAGGVVVNLRAEDAAAVDEAFGRAVDLGAEVLRSPHDAFWGARYAVLRGPGPLVVGLVGPIDPAARRAPPDIADFA